MVCWTGEGADYISPSESEATNGGCMLWLRMASSGVRMV